MEPENEEKESLLCAFYLLPRGFAEDVDRLWVRQVWLTDAWKKWDVLSGIAGSEGYALGTLKRQLLDSIKIDFPDVLETKLNIYSFRPEERATVENADESSNERAFEDVGTFCQLSLDVDLQAMFSTSLPSMQSVPLFFCVDTRHANADTALCFDAIEPELQVHNLAEDDLEQRPNVSTIKSPRRTGRKKGSQNLPAKSIFGRSDLSETESTDLNNALKKRKTLVITNAIRQVKKEGKQLKKSNIIPKALVFFVNETFIELTKVFKWPESRALRVLNYPKVRSNLNHRVIRAYGHMMRHSKMEDIVDQTETGSETSYISNRLIIRDSNAIVINSDESLSNESDNEEPSTPKQSASLRFSKRKSLNQEFQTTKKGCVTKSPGSSLSSQQGKLDSVFPTVHEEVISKIIYISMGTATLHLNTYFNLRKKKGMKVNQFLVMDEEQKKRAIQGEITRFGVDDSTLANDLEGMQLQLLTILEDPHVGWFKKTVEESGTHEEDEFEIIANAIPTDND